MFSIGVNYDHVWPFGEGPEVGVSNRDIYQIIKRGGGGPFYECRL